MKKRLICILLLLSVLAVAFSAQAAATTLTTGDLMLVSCSGSTPLYASYNPYDYTVITDIPGGATVMYIAAVDRGYCVGYQNFIGYVNEDHVTKVYGLYYDFPLPNGDAFRYAVSGSYSEPTYPGYNYPEYNYPEYDDSGYDYPEHNFPEHGWDSSVNGILYYPYRPQNIYPVENIATRSGPGTKYVSTGTFPSTLDYVAYYQTKGGSVNWGYVEFTYRNERYRLYTGVQRFTTQSYLEYAEEDYTYVDINTTHHVYYGPGYDYAQCSVDSVRKGKTVKAFYIENDWVMIEYSLNNGTLHRGWVPPGYWE